jgi:hypothetical protein
LKCDEKTAQNKILGKISNNAIFSDYKLFSIFKIYSMINWRVSLSKLYHEWQNNTESAWVGSNVIGHEYAIYYKK